MQNSDDIDDLGEQDPDGKTSEWTSEIEKLVNPDDKKKKEQDFGKISRKNAGNNASKVIK